MPSKIGCKQQLPHFLPSHWGFYASPYIGGIAIIAQNLALSLSPTPAMEKTTRNHTKVNFRGTNPACLNSSPSFHSVFLKKTPTTCQYSVSREKKKKIRPGGSAAKINELFHKKKNPQALLPSQQIRQQAPAGNYGVDFLTATTGLQPRKCVLLNNNT